jgi:hypothetical protein
MADIANNQKNTVGIENITSGNDLVVNSDGSINVAGLVNNIPASNTISKLVSEGKVFTLSGSFSATTAGTDNPIFLIKNPSGSGKIFYLYRILVGSATVNVQMDIRIFSNPTITSNGTSETPRNNLIGSSVTSAFTAFSLPTISANGTRLADLNVGQNNNSLDFLGDFSLQVQANNNILIAANPSSNNRSVLLTLVWAEV